MSLTPEALDRLQALAVASDADSINTGSCHPLAVVMAGPGVTKIVSLEEHMANRSRFRGTMKTASTKAFVQYVVGRNGDFRGFISAEKVDDLSCTAFFNLGDETSPGHGDDRAVLTPREMSAFRALRQIDGKQHTQQQLIDWLEDWQHVLSVADETGGYMTMAQAVASLRNVTLLKKGAATSQVGNLSATKSSMEQIEAKSDGVLPGVFTMRTAPFDGFAARAFDLRLSVLTGADQTNPKLALRWQASEKACEEIAEEFRRILVSELGGLAGSLVVGTFVLGA